MAGYIHVMMLPWSAFGHLIPFFNLSVALAKAGVRVSFVSTPRNIKRLPKVPPNIENLIDLLTFPLPILDKELLPEGCEATMDVPSEKIEYLKTAYDLLRNPVKQFISDQRPDWIFIDFISYWVAEIAQELKIPLLVYRVFSACQLAFMGHPESLVGDGHKRRRPSPESLTSPPEWGDFPSPVAYRSLEAIIKDFMNRMLLVSEILKGFINVFRHVKVLLYVAALNTKENTLIYVRR
ncbi:putative UDP-rhamnose:rhamnosyltransferase 1 [Durio zibethinus]|uniref:UDP-rhamnose:rhamnosyltransferase 1 n=1 Tax=Durio zibethinus TaxID=66656 RepID=A0A6P6A4T3_DURZI|nr:putative UDP-rhamnose:rhamnosyltransferase 1 [Durio zibethinus]